MKRILYILAASLLVLSSCNYLDTEQKSSFSDDVIYSNEVLAEGQIYSIYAALNEDRSYRNRLGLYMAVNTDIELKSGSKDATAGDGRRSIATYIATPSLLEGFNDEKNPWSWMYTGIERCNLAIVGIKQYGSPTTENKMGQLLGEALTMRAFFYYDLIRWWGDVPARYEPTNEDNTYIPKTPRAEIYEQIIADLEEAATYVPWAGEVSATSTVERANKAFVKGLRARICLSAAGKAMHPSGINDFVISDQNRRRELYAIAHQECLDIINSGRYILETEYEKIFKDQCQDVVSIGRESIFELPYSTSRGQWLSYMGLPAAAGTKWASIAVKGEVLVMPNFYYTFENGDKRRDVTVVPWKWVKDGNNSIQCIFSDNKKTSANANNWSLAKWRSEWMSRSYTSNDDGINMPVMRYADILLMYAEADLYLGVTDGAEYFNKVRRRAFGDPIDAAGPHDRTLTLNNIIDERAFEFCGEQLRKSDLIRWGKLKEKMDLAKDKMMEMKLLGATISPFDQFSSKVYYKESFDPDNANVKTLELFGFKHGETDGQTPSGAGWEGPIDWMNKLDTTMINSIYKYDPDKHQVLPIPSVILNGSRGLLTNDYGY